MKRTKPDPGVTRLLILIAVQSVCAAFFLTDAATDAFHLGLRAASDWHLLVETAAAMALVAAIVLETRMLMALLRRKAHLERNMSVAAGALHEVIEDHFQRWALTPAEHDVAMFTIKGFSIAEIADMRGSAPGTIKAQLHAIYRKSGVTGRNGLLALLVDDLLDAPLLPQKSATA